MAEQGPSKHWSINGMIKLTITDSKFSEIWNLIKEVTTSKCLFNEEKSCYLWVGEHLFHSK